MATDSLFTLGICSTDETDNLEKLIRTINCEPLPRGIVITDVVIAVSGGSRDTKAMAMNARTRFAKTVVSEECRSGKASAINRIISNMRGDNLLLINGDALPESGSVASLMEDLVASGSAMMCARPLPAPSYCNPVAGILVKFLWALHNSTMETLQSCGERLHLTDEMIAISEQSIARLPDGTVNDGAFMCTMAQMKGGAVSFSRRSVVRVSVPGRIRDVIEQRRRIVFGHLQVKELAGAFPGTAEFTAWRRPLVGLRILYDFSRRHPLESLILPLALAVEALSVFCALTDRKRGSNAHTIWKRAGNAAWR